jgi:hypothetical protein
VRREPAAPLVTHDDETTGERVEISATTLANWVARTVNLLQDEFDFGTTSRDPRSPVHRQTAADAGPAAWLLAPLSVGASLVHCRNADEVRLRHRAATERVTTRLGRRIEGVRELGKPA